MPLLVFLALSLYLFTGLLSGLPSLHNLHPLDALFSWFVSLLTLLCMLVFCPSPVLLVLPLSFAGLDCVLPATAGSVRVGCRGSRLGSLPPMVVYPGDVEKNAVSARALHLQSASLLSSTSLRVRESLGNLRGSVGIWVSVPQAPTSQPSPLYPY